MYVPHLRDLPPSVSLLFNTTRQRDKASLDVISNDILVDIMSNYLDVEDVLALRQVSRLYNSLSRQPVIWRRLLRRTTLPIPPLCPRYKLESITGKDAEELLCRAYELDRIWKAPPQQTDRWKFDSTEGYVAEMTMVAGGQFLLASVSNEHKEDWRIVIYAMHGREQVYPVAHLQTATKAYDIKAKWLRIEGKRSLSITYTIRKFVLRAHRRRGINVSEYPTHRHFTPAFPMKWEVRTERIHRDTLERLGGFDPEYPLGSVVWEDHFLPLQGKIFKSLQMIRSPHGLSHVSVDETPGQVIVTVVRGANTIMIEPLEKGLFTPAKLHLRPYAKYHQYKHAIKALRLFPQQRQILVVRQIEVFRGNSVCPLTVFELFDMPTIESICLKERAVAPVDSLFISEASIKDNIWITEPCLPNLYADCSDVRTDWLRGRTKPKPITTFLRSRHDSSGEEALLRMTFYPRLVDYSNIGLEEGGAGMHASYWKYDLRNRTVYRSSPSEGRLRYRAYPGTHRTLLTTAPSAYDCMLHDSVWSIHRYHSNELMAERRKIEFPKSFVVPDAEGAVRDISMEIGGTRQFEAVAWDEFSGRILFARPDQREIEVVDLARAPPKEPPPTMTTSRLSLGLGLSVYLLATRASSLIALAQSVFSSFVSQATA
ncbi:hypothetical protein PHLGIDRAFT_34752 [Phlebiopsis gigantea 11061_1 CR5-6]|uniref:F-box domain-containing protein n=1 Tax=Phlebiopsis gigantea (strain 11061_1 CR5-6) TaxID=745531 RepID=A0A0C3PPH3_PHLG1|nr:hypothetical protein PHLGIDRAFT_34752 [Phlebiopsis gigantea 11061_1 CR5-6]